MIGDGEVRTKQFKFVIVKLLCIVRDDYLWDLKQTNNVFPNKVLGVSFSDFGKMFRFYPLDEVVYSDNQNIAL